jgi:methyltransferase (TIGR00027 family)
MRSDRPSVTAQMVARGVSYIARVPQWLHLVPTDAASLTRTLLVTCAPAERYLLALLERPAFRSLVAAVERWVAPGILLHFALRKRYLEEVTIKAIEDGFRQVVVLGAGLDTLALRLHRSHPNVHFIEVDHPATQRCKRAAFDGDGPSVAVSNVHFLAADLGQSSLPDALSLCPDYAPNTDTLFIAEGLLMYLREADILRLFEGIREASKRAARCRFVFTFLEPQANGHTNFAHSHPILNGWLCLRGEPFRWGIRADELPEWLAGHGLAVQAIVTPTELRARYLDEPVAPIRTNGDILCVAERTTPESFTASMP